MSDHSNEHVGQAHASTTTYLVVAAILTVFTIIEVGVFYVPAMKPILAPTLLILSATKFTLVVGFYMHLKYDHSTPLHFEYLAGSAHQRGLARNMVNGISRPVP